MRNHAHIIRHLLAITIIACFMALSATPAVAGLFGKRAPKQAWREAIAASETPSEICRVLSSGVRYRRDREDSWQSVEDTWNRGAGDCEDFALCVREFCRTLGIDVEIRIYYPLDCYEGHVVAVGHWNGKQWVASNGKYCEANDDEAIDRYVAREMGTRRSKLFSVSLTEDQVEKMLKS